MIETIEADALIERVQTLSPYFEQAVHALADAPGVISIRNIGLAAGIELAPVPGAPGQRGAQAQAAAFEHGLLTRAPGDTPVLAPPFICEPCDIDRMVDGLRAAISDTFEGHPR
jgi:beta-alanine--pyruvate transaminase